MTNVKEKLTLKLQEYIEKIDGDNISEEEMNYLLSQLEEVKLEEINKELLTYTFIGWWVSQSLNQN